MKRAFIFLFILFSQLAVKTQTAVNFNANDCSGNNHILFNDLDAGKVVVITWVMPCGTCIGPALSAATEIQNFKNANPGKVIFYVADDYANTACNTLTGWCTTNAITNYDAAFSNSTIVMMDYGSNGMPKTVILAGATHSVFFNQNNTLTVANFNAAMTAALAAANSVGMKEGSIVSEGFVIGPNPAKEYFEITGNENERAVIYDLQGKSVSSFTVKKGVNRISTEQLPEGVYHIRSAGRFGKLVIMR